MPEHSLEEISLILDVGDLSKFIHIKEGLYFEAKLSTDYDLNTPSGRYELAKDVSAFANSDGGYLIVGLKTEPVLVERTDQVIELDLMEDSKFDVGVYQGVIKSYITPKILNLQIKWIEDTAQKGLGVGCIFVPKQENDSKYFLISNIVEGSEQIKNIVFGIARRVGSGNEPIRKDELYDLVRKGNTTTAEKLTRIEEKVNSLITKVELATQASEESKDILEKRIHEITSKWQ